MPRPITAGMAPPLPSYAESSNDEQPIIFAVDSEIWDLSAAVAEHDEVFLLDVLMIAGTVPHLISS